MPPEIGVAEACRILRDVGSESLDSYFQATECVAETLGELQRKRARQVERARVFLDVGDLPAALKVVLDLLEER